jgi:hypothetical protein
LKKPPVVDLTKALDRVENEANTGGGRLSGGYRLVSCGDLSHI